MQLVPETDGEIGRVVRPPVRRLYRKMSETLIQYDVPYREHGTVLPPTHYSTWSSIVLRVGDRGVEPQLFSRERIISYSFLSSICRKLTPDHAS